MNRREFTYLIRQKGTELSRDMPWRKDARAYYVLVSELMLQQTQVVRVVPKFTAFIARFPDEEVLAQASLADVVKSWQGLGYNRRAKYLHEAAKMVVGDFKGRFPQSKKDIMRLPGIGENTAGAILAYAFNQPAVFVETNVRTVYIHHFFADNFSVSDREIKEKVEATMDYDNPRQFYQHLMDYGSWLKAQGIKNTSQSRHYKKQSPLKGSLREMRGEILRRLTIGKLDWRKGIEQDSRFNEALAGLIRDGLVVQSNGTVYLTK